MYHCQHCGRESKKPNLMSLRIHEVRCESNPNRNTNIKTPSRAGKYKGEDASERTKRRKYTKERKEECLSSGEFICQFCGSNCDLKNDKSSFLSLMCHESQCPHNKDRVRNTTSDETKEKIRKALKGKKLSIEQREKISSSMQKVVEERPESYSHLNRSRAKKQIVDGIRFDSKWELIFYNWAKSQGLNPQRCNTSFSYTWDKPRKYFPDFYLPDLDLYVEIKGYLTDKDRAKWNSFPKKLSVIMHSQIEEIKKGTFKIS